MNQFIKGIIASCIELLYPKRCIACDKVLLKIEKESGFCKSCAKKIRLIGPNYCLT
ncbi:double zinc ribbon domain-containing protein [Pseudobutyrivibrio sp. OR37]|uniref:double zinc ribbon domain-containing protein n=1 Tax=Pseudobutyrivibrio sp. OR37 TaxID=1798186 RepID=UPI003FD4E482